MASHLETNLNIMHQGHDNPPIRTMVWNVWREICVISYVGVAQEWRHDLNGRVSTWHCQVFHDNSNKAF